MGSSFPDQRVNPHPLHWKHRVLTNGRPGKSLTELLTGRLSAPKQEDGGKNYTTGGRLWEEQDCTSLASVLFFFFNLYIVSLFVANLDLFFNVFI